MKKLVTLLLVLTGMVCSANADDNYVVVGDATMLGTSWDGSDVSNQMTLVRDNTYMLTKKDVNVTSSGWKEYKVYKNGDWEQGNWPTSSNAGLTLSEGTYDITFVFNLSNNEVFAFTSEKGIAVQGSFNSWSDLKLTQDSEDLVKYTGKYENYNASVGNVEYLLHANEEWNFQIKSGNENFKYYIGESQKFDLYFTADLAARTISMEAKRVVELGANGMGTFSSVDAHNFSGIDGLQAYYVSTLSSTAATLSTIDDVPGANGVLLIGASNGRYAIPYGAAEGTIDGNKLWAATSATSVDDVDGGGAYILYTDGLFHPATAGGSIPAGKAYLRKSDVVAAGVTAARSLSLVFDDETTGINTVKGSEFMVNGSDFFDLQGRKVAQPTKGLYIVNGKKVIIK